MVTFIAFLTVMYWTLVKIYFADGSVISAGCKVQETYILSEIIIVMLFHVDFAFLPILHFLHQILPKVNTFLVGLISRTECPSEFFPDIFDSISLHVFSNLK